MIDIEVESPLSLWIQLSSLAFFLAGHFSDLLVIRLCLVMAYLFLFLNSALGSPLWPLLQLQGKLSLDGLLWAVVNLYVHASTVVRLFADEAPVRLTPLQHALWRLFYRTGGISQRVFSKTVANHCTVVTFDQKGQVIPTDEYFYIVYSGAVQVTVTAATTTTTDDDDAEPVLISSRLAQSGQVFDFKALGMLNDTNHHLHPTAATITSQGGVSTPNTNLRAVAATANGVTLFRFPKDKIQQIAQHPSTRLLWKEILMENLLRIVQRYHLDKEQEKQLGQQGQTSTDYDCNGAVHPIFAPLQPWEEPHPLRAGSNLALQRPLAHIWASMKWSFAPPWPFADPPLGLRHTQLWASSASASLSSTDPSGGEVTSSCSSSSSSVNSNDDADEEDNDETETIALLTCTKSSELHATYRTMSTISTSCSTDIEEGQHTVQQQQSFGSSIPDDVEIGGMQLVGFKKAISQR